METGYTAHATRSKIKRGDWREGEMFRKAPDGRILMNLEAFELWAETEPQKPLKRRGRKASSEIPTSPACAKAAIPVSNSISITKASDAENG